MPQARFCKVVNSFRHGRCNMTTLLVIIVFFQVYLLFQNYQASIYLESQESQVFKENQDEYSDQNDVETKVSDPCQPRNDRLFPLCVEKFQYLKQAYALDCFEKVHGVTGSDCTIMQYLREIEPFCAKLNPIKKHRELAPSKLEFRDDLEGLLKILSLKNFDWLRQRAKHIWPNLMVALKRLRTNRHFTHRKKKKILFFLGSMGFQPRILESAGHGGFVGELVQWTDLIATTYILGHDISIGMTEKDLFSFLQPDENQCASKHIPKAREFDLIFSDLNGFHIMRHHGTGNHARLRCKIRLLDSFGTEAEFNYHQYDQPIPGGISPWGHLDILLPQFFTYFPHSPDNTFLGFIAGDVENKKMTKKDKALIYGKLDWYLDFVDIEYLEIIKDYFEIHATMEKTRKELPSYIINHGVVSSDKLKKLLEEAKIFIGLGFPYEGPGGLEAVANGAVFLNPKFLPPKNKLNDEFFKGKPNLRKITSQNPYMEDFIGEPYVYTIDLKDKATLVKTLREIKSKKNFERYLPREFTPIGMLERVHALIQHQDLCDPSASRWPPLKNMDVHLAPKGVSCKDMCRRKGKICEPSYFHDINDEKIFKNCVAFDSHHNRLCPCRDFMKGQTALCNGCL